MRDSHFLYKIKVGYKNILYVLTCSALLVALLPLTTIHAAENYTSLPISSSYKNPGKITYAGGLLWYIETPITGSGSYIGGMDSSGTTVDYSIPSPTTSAFTPTSLATGADGNVWFTGYTHIGTTTVYSGKLDISTGVTTFYSSPMPSYNSAGNIVAGADGNLWYSVKGADAANNTYLIKVDPYTGLSTIAYALGVYIIIGKLASSSDGLLWYTDNNPGNKRVYATGIIAGATGGSYAVPDATAYTQLGSIHPGKNGLAWLNIDGVLNKISTDTGTFSEPTLPAGTISDNYITDSDGTMWFLSSSTSPKQIIRITSSGEIDSYSTPYGTTLLKDLTIGPDNAVWFTSSTAAGGFINKITLTPDFSYLPITSGYKTPTLLTVANGTLWYLEKPVSGSGNYIGNISTTGTTADYNIPYPSTATSFLILSLTTGPDNNLWFSGRPTTGTKVYVGKFDTTTGSTTYYDSPYLSYNSPGNIVKGSDGNMWYAVKDASSNYTYIVKLNPTTGISTAGRTLTTTTNIGSIASGPDGLLWYTDNYIYDKRVHATALTGGIGAGWWQPASTTSTSYLYNIASGAVGTAWLTMDGKILKLSNGTFSAHTLPAGLTPGKIIPGVEGAMWFKATGSSNQIGHITNSGLITLYPSSSSDLALGPDSALWFTSGSGIGRLGY